MPAAAVLPPWATLWPLPSTDTLLATLARGRTLTPADRLALRRDGVLVGAPEQKDHLLQLAAQQAYFEGDHGTQRPAPSLSPYLRDAVLDDQPWEQTVQGQWPAWQGEAWGRFAHRATVAVWLDDGADPWVPWGEVAGVSWGLPEVLIAANDLGMLRRVLTHPSCPAPAALMDRRLAPLKQVRGQQACPWLHAAATHADGTLLAHLLGQGFDPNQVDGLGRTALFYVAGAAPLAHLLAAGTDPAQLDDRQEAVRTHLARTFDDYATTLGPVFDAQAPASDGLSADAIAEVFGQGRRGDWPAVTAAFDAAGPAWADWRQPITLKDGQARQASWLGSAALGLLDTDSDPRFRVAFTWHHDRVDVLTATEWLLAHAPASVLTHETLPGLPDGVAWSVMLHATPYLRVSPQGKGEDRRWAQADLDERFRTVREAWDARAMPGQSPLQQRVSTAVALRQTLGLWGPPSLWRERLSAIFRPLFSSYQGQNLLQQALEDLCWPRSGRPASDPQATWAPFWLALTQTMGDKALRTDLGMTVIKTVIGWRDTEQAALIAPTVRAALGSFLWLAMAEATAGYGYVEDRIQEAWRTTWNRWAQEGTDLDAKRLGGRALTIVHKAFPHLTLDPSTAAVVVAATTPRRRRP